MPANKRQDWTTDDAFWDDAWVDMEQRLDADTSRRRGGFAWWTWARTLVPAMLFLALLVFFWQRTERKAGQPSESPSEIPIRSEDISPDQKIAETKNHDTENEILNTAPLVPASTPSNISPLGGQATTRRAPLAEVDNRGERNGEAERMTPPPTEADSQRENLSLTQSLPRTLLQATKSETLSSRPVAQAQKLRITPPLDGRATTRPTSLVQFTTRPTTEVILQPQRQPAQLRLDAGVTAQTDLSRPGAYAGLSFLPASRSRLRFPIALQLRRNNLRINDIGPNDQVAANDFTSIPTPGVATDQSPTEALLDDLRRSGFDEIRTLGLELRTGVEYQLNKKLSLTGGLGLEYLLEARGPIVSLDTAVFRELGGLENFVDLQVGRGGVYELSSVNQSVGETGSGSSSGRVFQFVPRAYLGLRYGITSRLGLDASVDLILRDIYQDDIARLAPARMRLGFSWRLR